MPPTRRTQLLMDPGEFRQLRALARRKNTSIAELIRTAVRANYLRPQRADRAPIVEAILRMKLTRMNWKRARKEIEAGHAGLS